MIQQKQNIPQTYRVAVDYQLGELLAEYKVMFSRTLVFMFTGFIILVFSLVVISLLNGIAYSDIPIPARLWGIFFLGLVFYCLIYRPLKIYLHRHQRMLIYTDGFVYITHSSIHVIRWEQVESLIQSVRPYSRLPGITCVCTIRLVGGNAIKLSDSFHNISGLADMLEREVTRILLPKIIEAYNAGQPITFGNLCITQQGLRNGTKFLSWQQVRGVKVILGTIAIFQEGKRLSWSEMPISVIPNIGVLTSLIKHGIHDIPSSLHSSEAYMTAIHNQPGRILAEYKMMLSRSIVFMLAFEIFVELLCVAITVYDHYFLMLTAFLGLLLFLNIKTLYFYWNTWIVLGKNGFVYVKKKSKEILFWEQIESVSGAEIKGMITTHVYVITRKNGTIVKFDDRFYDLDEFSRILGQEVLSLLLPRAFASYSAGKTISFGKLKVNRYGITIVGRLLPWNQIQSITINRNNILNRWLFMDRSMLTINSGVKSKKVEIPVSQVPNCGVLMALVEQVMGSS